MWDCRGYKYLIGIWHKNFSACHNNSILSLYCCALTFELNYHQEVDSVHLMHYLPVVGKVCLFSQGLTYCVRDFKLDKSHVLLLLCGKGL
jgi:hypothetical protein